MRSNAVIPSPGKQWAINGGGQFTKGANRVAAASGNSSVTFKFGHRAWGAKRRSRFVILSAVFVAKDLTRPDEDNPKESIAGRCQRAFDSLKGEVVCFERALR